MKLKLIALIAWCALSVPAAWAQAATPGTIDAALKADTVEKLASVMHTDYVFPDLAAKIAADLRSRLKAGEYDSIVDGRELAHRLMEDMGKITKDAHLRVGFSKNPLPPREEESVPNPEEEAAYREQVRLTNASYQKVERLIGNVGYLELTNFASPEDAARPAQAAMEFLANTDALIIDLRRNGGGDPAGVQLLCSYLFGERTHLNDLYFRKENKTTEFWTLDKLPAPRYLNRDVYVLVSKRTGSGAEEFAYNLKNLKRALILGENTWGGANPGDQYRLNDHFRAFIPTGRAINPYTKTNWEGTGVDPDIRVDPADGLKLAHKMAIQKLLESAKTDEAKQRYESALKDIDSGK